MLTGVFSVLLWMYITRDKIWMGEYKNNFNWNKYSSLCYLFPIFQRFLVGILFTAASVSFAPAIISIVLLIICILAVALKKPFVEMY